MEALTEIRWHGRGGQGAKTAALLLAEAAFNIGKHVQGFPEYGPERMGAPITAYDRISDGEIRVHSNIYEPDYVAVVDDTLLHTVDVTKGLKTTGGIFNQHPEGKAGNPPVAQWISGGNISSERLSCVHGNDGPIFPQHPYAGGISERFPASSARMFF